MNSSQISMIKTVSARCQKLTEVITNALLSFKLPGEEHSTIRNGLQSTTLGKKESSDLSLLEFSDGEASFVFPYLDEEGLKSWIGDVSEVGIEVNNYFSK